MTSTERRTNAVIESEAERSTSVGRLLVLAAALLWSTSGLILKSPPLAAISAAPGAGPVLACYRALFAAVLLVPFVRRKSIRWRPALVPMVVTFTLMNLLFVPEMTRTTAAAAIFLQYTSTFWAFVFGVLVLREPVDRGNLVALVCAVAGIAWIVSADWGGENFVGNLIAMGSGLSLAGVIVILRHLRDEDSAWLVALNHVVAGVALLPLTLAVDLSLDATQWTLLVLLGMSQMAVPYVLFARGVRRIATQEAALIALLEPILNPIWVWVAWGRAAPVSTWVGGGLIVGGLLARYVMFPARRNAAA